MKKAGFYILLIAVCGSQCASGKSKPAPLPDGVSSAKTVHLVNHTGKQAILDSAYNEFQKWNRFQVVNDESADLRVVFSGGKDGAGSSTTMEVFVRGDQDAAFETTEAGLVPAGLVQQLIVRDRSAKQCVDDFWKRLEISNSSPIP
jgi:hypothetical protein